MFLGGYYFCYCVFQVFKFVCFLLQSRVELIKQKTRQLARDVLDLIDLVAGSSPRELEDEHFKQVFCGAQHIFGFNAGVSLAAVG